MCQSKDKLSKRIDDGTVLFARPIMCVYMHLCIYVCKKYHIHICKYIFRAFQWYMQFSLGLCSLFQIYKNIACIVWLYPKFLGDFAARRTAFGSQFHKCLVQGEVWRIGLLNGEIPGSAWEFAGFLGILLSNIKFSGSFQFTLCILTKRGPLFGA